MSREEQPPDAIETKRRICKGRAGMPCAHDRASHHFRPRVMQDGAAMKWTLDGYDCLVFGCGCTEYNGP